MKVREDGVGEGQHGDAVGRAVLDAEVGDAREHQLRARRGRAHHRVLGFEQRRVLRRVRAPAATSRCGWARPRTRSSDAAGEVAKQRAQVGRVDGEVVGGRRWAVGRVGRAAGVSEQAPRMPPSEMTTPSPRLRARLTSESIRAKLGRPPEYLIESPVKWTQRAPRRRRSAGRERERRLARVEGAGVDPEQAGRRLARPARSGASAGADERALVLAATLGARRAAERARTGIRRVSLRGTQNTPPMLEVGDGHGFAFPERWSG